MLAFYVAEMEVRIIDKGLVTVHMNRLDDRLICTIRVNKLSSSKQSISSTESLSMRIIIVFSINKQVINCLITFILKSMVFPAI